MAAMNMVSAGGFSGISFHLRRCPQGVACVLCKKNPIFGSRRSKLDHLTVSIKRRRDNNQQVLEKRLAFGVLCTSAQLKTQPVGFPTT
jgi:hypothetical protein